MTKRCVMGLVLVGAIVAAVPASGQGVPRNQRAALVKDVEQAFLNQMVREMGLSDEQVPRFQHVVTLWAQKRASLEADERRIRQSLNGELRPGVAGNSDSVSKFVDALDANRVAYAESFRDEMHDLAPILTPIQRGLFQLSRDRLLQRVKELQLQRPGPAARGTTPQP